MSESNHNQQKKIQNPNLLSPNAAYRQPQISNTQMANAQIANAQIANTQIANTQIANTQIANTQIANTQVTKTQIVNTAGKVGKSHHEYLKIMAEQKGVTEFRKITLQQLYQHRKKSSAWLSLGGIVYDVTVYLNYHPGGSILLEGCGKQCSDLFNQYHPWVNAKYLLQKYKIGFLGR